VTKIDAFAHILPPAYAERLEPLVLGAGVSDRILGFQPWIHEDPALTRPSPSTTSGASTPTPTPSSPATLGGCSGSLPDPEWDR